MEDVLGPFQLRHGTRIRITHLHKNVLASLRNRDVLMQIRAEVRAEGRGGDWDILHLPYALCPVLTPDPALCLPFSPAQVAQDYFFFLCGFPEVIRSHIPYVSV